MCNCTLHKIPKSELRDFKTNYAKAVKYSIASPSDELENHMRGKLDIPLDFFIGYFLDVKDRNFDEKLEYALDEGERREGTEPRCALLYATDLLRSFNGKHK